MLAKEAKHDDKLVTARDFATAVWRCGVLWQRRQLDRVDAQGKRHALGCRVKSGSVLARCASGHVDDVRIRFPPHVEIARGGQDGRIGLRDEECVSVA